MHTGWTAVFGQSTLVCDLLCRGPLCLAVALMNALQKKAQHFSSASSLPLSAGSLYDIRLHPISQRFGFHQISDEAITFPEGAGSLVNSLVLQIGPGKCLNDSPRGTAPVVSFFHILSNINNNVTSIYTQYISLVWQLALKKHR